MMATVIDISLGYRLLKLCAFRQICACCAFVFTFAFSVSPIAFAGGSSDGGGKGFLCTEDEKKSGYLADTYGLTRSGALKDFYLHSDEAVILAAAKLIEHMRPEKNLPHPYLKDETVSLAWMIEHTWGLLKFEEKFYYDDPTYLADDYITEVPPNCEMVQLALQDLSTGVVTLFMERYRYLSEFEKGFLKLHEIFIAIRNTPLLDTTPIRAQVNTLAKALDDPRLSIGELARNLLLAKNTHPYRKSQSENQRLYFQNCLMSLDSSSSDCRRLKALVDTEEKEIDEKFSLPTLWQIPTTLQCEVVRQNSVKGFHGLISGPFTLKLVNGDGRPGFGNTLEMNPKLSGFQSNSVKVDFQTYRRQRSMSQELGRLIMNAFWKSIDAQAQVRILQYNARTNEFFGVLFVARHPRDSNQTYGYQEVSRLVCRGQTPRFATDLERAGL